MKPVQIPLGDEDGMVVLRFEDCAEVLEKSRKRVSFEGGVIEI